MEDDGTRVQPYGDSALLLTPAGPDHETRWRRAQGVAAQLRRLGPEEAPWLVDVVATYEQVFVALDPDRDDGGPAPVEVVRRLADRATDPAAPVGAGGGRPLVVPVRFGGADGPDLEDVARELGLSPDALVERLVAAPWTVRFVASPVGSPFAERDDWDVSVARSASPRTAVPPGSVALSGAQAMIYPVRSPGGWRLVGRTSEPLVAPSPDADADAPTAGLVPWAPGDRLQLAPADDDPATPAASTTTRAASTNRPASSPSTRAASTNRPASSPSTRASSATTPAASACSRHTRADEPPGLRVLAAGRMTLQDRGRPGLGHLGVPVGGAADGGSADLAAVLVGGRPGTPLLELTASGATLEATADLLVAITGAVVGDPTTVTVDGAPVPVAEPVLLPRGGVLAVPAPQRGLRSYVAVAGGLEVADGPPPLLGSVAPDPTLDRPGHLGRGDLLLAGHCLCGWRPRHDGVAFRLGVGAALASSWARAWSAPETLVEAVAGPERDEFAPAELVGPWAVSASSDHVGLRLEGATPARTGGGELLSRGVPVGAVEVPPAGGLLALMRGRLVTAGYPVPLVATSLAVDRLGQARPGDVLRLREVDVDRARAARRARTAALAQVAARARTALAASGLGRLST